MPNQIQSLSAVISELITMLARGTLEPGYERSIQRGSAHGTVAITLSPVHRARLLVISLDIMRSPDPDRSDFFRRLLELNASMDGRAAFSIEGDGIVRLRAGRPLEDLDDGELVELIIWTADQADRLDDVLLDEFGREHAL